MLLMEIIIITFLGGEGDKKKKIKLHFLCILFLRLKFLKFILYIIKIRFENLDALN